MIRFKIDRRIHQPIEDVFERIVDIHAYRHWMPQSWLFKGSETVDAGSIGEGTKFIDKTSLGTLPGVVTRFEPPRAIRFRQSFSRRGKTVFESRPGYVLEPVEDGTVVHHLAEGEPYGALRFLEPVLCLMARLERRRTVNALERSFGDD